MQTQQRQDETGLKLRRKYFSRAVQACLLLSTLINTTLVFYENPEAQFLGSSLTKKQIVPAALELLSLLIITADAAVRYIMIGKRFYKVSSMARQDTTACPLLLPF